MSAYVQNIADIPKVFDSHNIESDILYRTFTSKFNIKSILNGIDQRKKKKDEQKKKDQDKKDDQKKKDDKKKDQDKKNKDQKEKKDQEDAEAKIAAAEKRPVIDVAKELTDIPHEELKQLLDPKNLADWFKCRKA